MVQRILISIALSAAALLSPTEASSQRLPGPSLPLGVVTRGKAQSIDILDKPSLILLIRVTAVERYEQKDREGDSLSPKVYVTNSDAQVEQVMRVNERLASHPDLKGGRLVIQHTLRDRATIKSGRSYVVMLDPVPEAYVRNPIGPPAYGLSADECGFEVVAGRVIPLVGGGPLDAYKGLTVQELAERLAQRGAR